MFVGNLFIDGNGDGSVNFELFQYRNDLQRLNLVKYYDGQKRNINPILGAEIQWTNGKKKIKKYFCSIN